MLIIFLDQTHPSTKWIRGGIWLAMMGGLAGILTWGWGTFWEEEATKTWPKAPGKVVHSRLIREPKRTLVDVRYEYQVDGKTYSGTKVSLREENAYYAEMAIRIQSKLSEGMRIEVYFDPADPRRALLQPGGDHLMKNGLIAVSIFEAVLLIVFAFQVRYDFFRQDDRSATQQAASS